jgi:predicted metallopeptidase
MCEIVRRLGLTHIDCNRVVCLRGVGSKTKRVIARCHALPKVMQLAMEVKAHYAIEFLERFEKLSEADQDMTIIHELMHIPKTFGGGFRHHDFVCRKNVEELYKTYLQSHAE